jgi:AcrR family transcriptional regulator
MSDPLHPPQRPRRRLTKEQRRRQLLAAAEQVFAERGYGGTTFEDIAARAQVTRPLLYGHFASLDEVYLECVRTAREELQQRLTEAMLAEGLAPRARVQAGLRAYFAFVQERATRWHLLYGPGGATGPAAAQAAEMRFATAQRVAGLLEAFAPRLPHEDAVVSAHILSGAAEQLARWWRRHPEVGIDEIVSRTTRAVWTGLGDMIARSDSAEHSKPRR